MEDVAVESLDFQELRLNEPIFAPAKVFKTDQRIIVYDEVEPGGFKIFNGESGNFLFAYPPEDDPRYQFSFVETDVLQMTDASLRVFDYPIYSEFVPKWKDKKFSQRRYFDLSKLDFDFKSPVYLGDSLFLLRNNMASADQKPFVFVSFKAQQSRSATFFGEFPVSSRLDFASPQDRTSHFRARVVVNREKRRIALFYVLENYLQVYDFNGNLLYAKAVGDRVNPTDEMDKGLYFESPISHQDLIYVLYIGKSFKAVNASPEEMDPEIHVYDWDGTLLKRYATGESIRSFAIDSDHKAILGVTFSEKTPLVYAPIKDGGR